MFMFDSTLSGTVSHTFTCDLIMTFTCDLITTFTYDLIYMWFDNNFYMCFDDNFYMWFDDDFYLWFNELRIVLFCLVAVCFFVVFEPQSVDLPDWHNFFSFAAFKQVPLNAFWRFAVNAFFVCVSCGCMKFKDWYPAIVGWFDLIVFTIIIKYESTVFAIIIKYNSMQKCIRIHVILTKFLVLAFRPDMADWAEQTKLLTPREYQSKLVFLCARQSQ